MSTRKKIQQKELLIIDDFGGSAITGICEETLLSVIDERLSRKSLIIASQISISQRHKYFQNLWNANAFIDRGINNSYMIQLKGRSLREKYGAVADTSELNFEIEG